MSVGESHCENWLFLFETVPQLHGIKIVSGHKVRRPPTDPQSHLPLQYRLAPKTLERAIVYATISSWKGPVTGILFWDCLAIWHWHWKVRSVARALLWNLKKKGRSTLPQEVRIMPSNVQPQFPQIRFWTIARHKGAIFSPVLRSFSLYKCFLFIYLFFLEAIETLRANPIHPVNQKRDRKVWTQQKANWGESAICQHARVPMKGKLPFLILAVAGEGRQTPAEITGKKNWTRFFFVQNSSTHLFAETLCQKY